MSKGNGDRPAGAPVGSQNGLSHGIVAFKNQVKHRARRGRSLIDRRSTAGRNAFAMREELIADMGGTDQLSTAKLALIEMTARDVYFLDEIDRRIFRAIYKLAAKEKALESLGKIKNPKMIATMYGYRQTAANNLARNLLALGLEKVPPKPKTLEEILSEDDQPEEP
jgi:hypothetical protein